MSVETFYPINTPLINYFFYKAPFVSSSFVLTKVSVQNGGSGYTVGDVIVASGGTFTSPVTLRVSSVTLGAVTGVTITSNGKYTVTPILFTQAYSSGSGVGATFNNLSFVADILPPGPNIPLAGGFIYFYADEDHTLELPTYSDVFDPQNPVVNTNPIQLGAAGDCPLFYLEDRLYYIVITDYTGDQSNPIATINHYNPKSSLIGGAYNNNFIVNPQFNYPIEFYKTTDEVGEISQPVTVVAWGCQFIEDDGTLTKNYVTFENVQGQGIEGDPINQIVLNCTVVSASESNKNFKWRLGQADFSEGSQLTFCAQMINKKSGTASVDLVLQTDYGDGGSGIDEVILENFSVTGTRQKFVHSFTMPSITGKTVGEDSGSYIMLRPALGQICHIGATNIMTVPGNVANPIFVSEPTGFSKAQILGVSTDIEHAGLAENYSSYYYKDGEIFPYSDTATIFLQPKVEKTPFREECLGSERFVNGYSESGIPYRRLYNVIGTTFGGSGSLIAGARGKEVSFESSVGARENSAYTAGTTSFVVTNTLKGLALGISIVNNNDNTVTATFFDDFAPMQTIPVFPVDPIGNQIFKPSSYSNQVAAYWGTIDNRINPENITINTTNSGSVSTKAVFTISFDSTEISDYQTKTVATSDGSGRLITSSFIEFASVGNNVRQYGGAGTATVNQLIMFALDGVLNPQIGIYSFYNIGNLANTIVNFKKDLSLQQNIKTFVNTVANPFVWTMDVNAIPTAGQYFLYSSPTVDYYGWFKVNGVGTDPAISGRTGVAIETFTGQTEEQIAQTIANTVNTASFSLPSLSDLPALVADSKVSWFINL